MILVSQDFSYLPNLTPSALSLEHIFQCHLILRRESGSCRRKQMGRYQEAFKANYQLASANYHHEEGLGLNNDYLFQCGQVHTQTQCTSMERMRLILVGDDETGVTSAGRS